MKRYKQITKYFAIVLLGIFLLSGTFAVDVNAQLEVCKGALQSGSEGVENGECVPPPPTEVKDCNGVEISKDAICPYKPSSETQPNGICGKGETQVVTAINFGCNGVYDNGILDLSMAILRTLVNGVGIVLIGATMWAGIQYGVSRGDPNLVSAAKKRLFNVFISLLIYMFSFAIINFLIPGFFS